MEIKQKGVLHNEFLIEVVDVNTNEIKGQYKAYNIILDQLFTRILSLSSYFTSIHFGTGTGNLDRTRNSLFTFLGAKGATIVSETGDVVSSNVKVQRVIQIMPEEYVGSVITEVGVAFGTTNNNLCTHAFILDSQGNPVGITKSATDVINIYATVYVTYDTGHPNIEIASSMYANGFAANYVDNLFTYLLVRQSNGLFTSARWQLGKGSSNLLGRGYIENSFATSEEKVLATTTWTKDIVNRTLTSNPYRFNVNSGNGNISEIGITNFIRAVFPVPGVWEGYKFKDKPLGVGDGITKEFLLTSIESPIPGSVVVKSSDIVKDGGYQQKTYFDGKPNFIKTFSDGSDYNGHTAQGSFCSRDRTLIVESQFYSGSPSSNAIKLYRTEENGRFLDTERNAEMRTFYFGDITEDNRFIVNSTPTDNNEGYCYLYRRRGSNGFDYEAITGLVGLNEKSESESNGNFGGQGVCFSRDGKLLFTSYTTITNSIYNSGRLFKYNEEKDIYEKSNIDYNGFSLVGALKDIRVTVDNKYFIALTTQSNTANSLMVFEIGEDKIKAVDKNILFDSFQPTGTLSGLKISDDGSILVLCSLTEKAIYIYELIEGRYTLKNKVLTALSMTSLVRNSVDISPNNNYICFSVGLPYLLRKGSDGQYEFAYNNSISKTITSGNSAYRGMIFGNKSDTLWCNVQHTGSGTFSNPGAYTDLYSLKENATKIIFDEPPTEGEVLTFDCDVNYIPKDTNSVLDLQITVQFSDANETI